MELNKNNENYKQWLTDLKAKVHSAQLKAAVTVNKALLHFYWELGGDIVVKQKEYDWGSKFLDQLSKDLTAEFPEMKGFSVSNLKHIRRWYLFYNQENTIGQQLVIQIEKKPFSQLTQIPWGHNVAIISKCKNTDEAFFYVRQTIKNHWSRNVLIHQIESGLYRREAKAITNFKNTLPGPQSDLAQQTLKSPYVFDFLSLTKDYTERELEKKLTEHITQFLLELGAGFAYIGRQVPLQVGSRDFYIDLLFYHTQLHCYVVIELKTGEFEPEHAGKLNFYIKAVDEQLRKEKDEATIGIILCKGKDKLVVEYALSDIHKPMGISEYQLTQALPDNLKASLPTIEALEKELGGDYK